jgi:hypothetical protein
MPRANRHFLPGHVWHIMRCYQQAFLLKFARGPPPLSPLDFRAEEALRSFGGSIELILNGTSKMKSLLNKAKKVPLAQTE